MIYHSKSGNCGKLCEDIAKKLNVRYEIRTDEVKKIKPEDIGKHPPDVLIVGSRITFGKPDKIITGFVKKLGKKLNSPISKAATFYTHMSPWQNSFAQMNDILKDNNVVKEFLPDFLEFKIQDTGKTSGSPEPGQEPKIDEFVNKVQNFIGI
ncbi:MAG: flavodoxin family protein [Promethearchaeota archaeon]|jgi:menaquinone-dependent protoporphyrinogen IX oxidase